MSCKIGAKMLQTLLSAESSCDGLPPANAARQRNSAFIQESDLDKSDIRAHSGKKKRSLMSRFKVLIAQGAFRLASAGLLLLLAGTVLLAAGTNWVVPGGQSSGQFHVGGAAAGLLTGPTADQHTISVLPNPGTVLITVLNTGSDNPKFPNSITINVTTQYYYSVSPPATLRPTTQSFVIGTGQNQQVPVPFPNNGLIAGGSISLQVVNGVAGRVPNMYGTTYDVFLGFQPN
jgi:hypothetical protein